MVVAWISKTLHVSRKTGLIITVVSSILVLVAIVVPVVLKLTSSPPKYIKKCVFNETSVKLFTDFEDAVFLTYTADIITPMALPSSVQNPEFAKTSVGSDQRQIAFSLTGGEQGVVPIVQSTSNSLPEAIGVWDGEAMQFGQKRYSIYMDFLKQTPNKPNMRITEHDTSGAVVKTLAGSFKVVLGAGITPVDLGKAQSPTLDANSLSDLCTVLRVGSCLSN